MLKNKNLGKRSGKGQVLFIHFVLLSWLSYIIQKYMSHIVFGGEQFISNVNNVDNIYTSYE